jgi:carbamoyl-phosphate synthase / aspartate carbamoyltransferase
LGTVNGLTVTFTGDLKYGRTVHSLCELLKHYDAQIQLVAPEPLSMPSEIVEHLEKRGQLKGVYTELTPEVVARSDVLYCTRIQKERFEDPSVYDKVKDQLVVDDKMMKHAKPKMVVMHPLPRNQEITEEVDFDPRAAYFRQVSNPPYSGGV